MSEEEIKLFIEEYYKLKNIQQSITTIDKDFLFKLVDGILDLYKKKSKMVDLMAENLTTPTHNKEWVIKYFEGEVELEDNA